MISKTLRQLTRTSYHLKQNRFQHKGYLYYYKSAIVLLPPSQVACITTPSSIESEKSNGWLKRNQKDGLIKKNPLDPSQSMGHATHPYMGLLQCTGMVLGEKRGGGSGVEFLSIFLVILPEKIIITD